MLDHQVGEKIWTRRTTNDEVISKWEIKVEIWAYLPLDHLWQPPDISNATAVTACFEQRKVWELTWWKNIWKHNGKQRSSKWGTCTKTARKKGWNLAVVDSTSQKKLYACPKQEKAEKGFYEQLQWQPEKTLLLILKCQKCVIKLHHNSVWLSPKWNPI